MASITGTEKDDNLTGGPEDDFLRGLGGNDTLNGGSGTDTAMYDDAPGAITLNLASGLVSGSVGNDKLVGMENAFGSRFNDTLVGDGFDNELTGFDGNDSISGGAGNDILRSWSGNNTLDGSSGNDTATYDYAGAGVNADLSKGVSVWTQGRDVLANVENLSGSTLDDFLIGNSEGNRLFGDAGSDVLQGGTGSNTLDGGDGQDAADYSWASGAITVDLEKGASSGSDFNDTLISIEIVLGSEFSDRLTGSTLADTLGGNDGSDSIDGGFGDDLIAGGLGSNTLNGGPGVDTVSYADAASGINVDLASRSALGAGRTDVLTDIEAIVGTGSDDALAGDALDNRLDGAAGNDSIAGGGGNDTIVGGDGFNALAGDDGFDAADYSLANSSITVDLNRGTVKAKNLEDTVASIESVIGSRYSDVINGDAAANTLRGNDGDDVILGGQGDDTAVFAGDLAEYQFSFNSSSGAFTVRDFVSSRDGTDAVKEVEIFRFKDVVKTAFELQAVASQTDNGLTTIIGTDGTDALSGHEGGDLFIGLNGNDSIDGFDGIDMAAYSSIRSDYSIGVQTSQTTPSTVTDQRNSLLSDGSDVLRGIERLRFSDVNIALDLDGHAGQTVKLLAAVFGLPAASTKTFVGIGLKLLDAGMSYEELATAAMTAIGIKSNADAVSLLWFNLFGDKPSDTQIQPIVEAMENGVGIGALTVFVADLELNTNKIDLAGLTKLGVEYL